MITPKVTWPEGFYNGNSPMGTINSATLGQDDASKWGDFKGIPDNEGVKKITLAMELTGAKTVRGFIQNSFFTPDSPATKECGMAVAAGEKQPLPNEVDFPWGHPGPCEVWCDNTRIFSDSDCQGNGKGTVPVDAAQCAGASFIQGMYIGVHTPDWQVYVNCAPLEGGSETDPTKVFTDTKGDGGGGGGGGDDGATPAPTPAPAPAPQPTSNPPPAADKTPATNAPKTKCNRRFRE